MKKGLYLLFTLVVFVINSCNSDEPQDGKDIGFLTVSLNLEDASKGEDFSDYTILIMPENGGFGWETPYQEISWPVSRPAGEYVVIAQSPLVSETETSRFFYTAMERNVPIVKNKTTEITLTLELKEFPKD